MRVFTPDEAARHTQSKYLGVLVAAKEVLSCVSSSSQLFVRSLSVELVMTQATLTSELPSPSVTRAT